MRGKPFALIVIIVILSTSIAAEDALERGRRLFNEGKYTEAVEVLTSYSQSIEGVGAEAKRYAEANYLLARIYFDAGEDAQVEDYLKKALNADRDIGRDETVKSFKAKVDALRPSILATDSTVAKAARDLRISEVVGIFQKDLQPGVQLNIGSEDGIAPGKTGKLFYYAEISGRKVKIYFAKFEITEVNSNSCMAVIVVKNRNPKIGDLAEFY